MIVNDHAVIRSILRKLFEAEEFEVSNAVNGADGVQKAQKIRPALVILDLFMPVMNGLARCCSGIEDAHAERPVAVVHRYRRRDGGEREARCVGISAVISKSESNALGVLLAHAKALLGPNWADGPQHPF